MADKPEEKSDGQPDGGKVSWGPRLFLGALVALLVFFYWLLIYSGGVTVHHS